MKKYGLVVIALLYFITFTFAGEVTKNVNVKYFFPKAETWFTVPNWFYYWRDGLFGGNTDITYEASVNWGNTPPNGSCVQIGNNTGYGPDPRHGKVNIDCFYCVSTHELQHLSDIRECISRYGDMFGVPQSQDDDTDYLPNDMDPFPNSINGAGYPEYTGSSAWKGDWEYRARQVENVVADSQTDWAHPGKNWP